MALRIPKVPIWDELDRETWDYIHKEKERFILLESKLNLNKACMIIKLLVSFEYGFRSRNKNEKLPIPFYINSDGGNLDAALLIVDTINSLKSNVYTVVLGSARSSAALILSAGTAGKRCALPNARVNIGQDRTPFPQASASLNKRFNFLIKQRKVWETERILAQNIKQHIDILRKHIYFGYDMSASKALKFGVVDKIVKNKK